MVLCIDSGKTQFDTARLLSLSGVCRVMTATNPLVAARVAAVAPIDACVLCDDLESVTLEITRQLATVCPEVPKIVVGGPIPLPVEVAEQFHFVPAQDPVVLLEAVRELASTSCASARRTKDLLRKSRELRQVSSHLQQEMRRKLEDLCEKLPPATEGRLRKQGNR